jgi:hypothetical protein
MKTTKKEAQNHPTLEPAHLAGIDTADEGEAGRSRRFKEVWLVEDRKNARSVWTRVGTAFENGDGSWNIRLSALPVGTGRLNVRDPLPRDSQGRDAPARIEQERVSA